jgi:RNA polymerase sigma-70 factor, ECF subfamily
MAAGHVPLAPQTAQRQDRAMNQTDATGSVEPFSRWTELVQRIQDGDKSGMEDLYKVFSRGIRYYLCRQLGPQELDDKVHDAFLIVVQAIQRGDLREPDRLMGFVRTVVRRQIAAHIDQAVSTRRDQMDLETTPKLFDAGANPEEHAIGDERAAIMREVLREISHRDREILTRFYLQEQSQEQICSEMDLSETQFRLLKSRAKARFGELGRKRLTSRPLSRLIRAVTGE